MAEKETEVAMDENVADEQSVKSTTSEPRESTEGETTADDAVPPQEREAASEGSAHDTNEGETSRQISQTEQPNASSGTQNTSIRAIVMVIAVVAALLLGLLGGSIFFGGAPANNSLTGKASVSESELDSNIAAYTLNGKTEAISVRDVIEQTSSLAAVQNSDGSYAIPSADSVLAAARNKMLVAEAEAQGISVSDDEVAAYAKQQLGASDLSSVGQNYGMDSASVTQLLHDTCLINKLRESVVGDSNAADAELPDPPTEPSTVITNLQSRAANDDEDSDYDEEADDADEYANGSANRRSSRSASEDDEENATRDNEEDEEPDGNANSNRRGSSSSTASSASSTSKEYADYIISLVGDEWDTSKGTWASTDGPYYKALSTHRITPEGATYEAATAAYYVAYQMYSERATAMTDRWNEYMNSLLNKASITIYTMAS